MTISLPLGTLLVANTSMASLFSFATLVNVDVNTPHIGNIGIDEDDESFSVTIEGDRLSVDAVIICSIGVPVNFDVL